jgi:hypothetical protein
MSDLLFIRRSLRLRHAAAAELRRARALPAGSMRDEALRRSRGLMELARTEAWLEGQSLAVDRDRDARHGRTTGPVAAGVGA